MSDIEVTFQSNGEEIGELFEQACERALTRIGLQCESFVKKEFPVDTGNLRNSVSNRVEMSERSAYIGTNVEYSPYVELGTSKAAAQPFLKPAATEHNGAYKRIIEDEMKNA